MSVRAAAVVVLAFVMLVVDAPLWASAGGETVRVSVSTAGADPDQSSEQSSLAGGGGFVAFKSNATNLVDDDSGDYSDVFVRDLESGTTDRVSVTSAEVEADGHSRLSYYGAAISRDGRFVVFMSQAANLGVASGGLDVFVRDREEGTTTKVSVASDGFDIFWGEDPAISADGRYVAFRGREIVDVEGSPVEQVRVFVRDLEAGTTAAVSPPGFFFGSVRVSDGGRYVAVSMFDALLAEDTNGQRDITCSTAP